MSNPYAPPRAAVQDIADPGAHVAHADRMTRLVAALLDAMIFTLMVYVPLFAAGTLAGATAEASGSIYFARMVGLMLPPVGFVVYCGLTIMLMKRNGQSMGKKLLSIKVVRSDGTPASLARLIWLRNVLNWIISLIPIYVLIDVLFIFGERRQCLHDKFADTIVVKA